MSEKQTEQLWMENMVAMMHQLRKYAHKDNETCLLALCPDQCKSHDLDLDTAIAWTVAKEISTLGVREKRKKRVANLEIKLGVVYKISLKHRKYEKLTTILRESLFLVREYNQRTERGTYPGE